MHSLFLSFFGLFFRFLFLFLLSFKLIFLSLLYLVLLILFTIICSHVISSFWERHGWYLCLLLSVSFGNSSKSGCLLGFLLSYDLGNLFSSGFLDSSIMLSLSFSFCCHLSLNFSSYLSCLFLRFNLLQGRNLSHLDGLKSLFSFSHNSILLINNFLLSSLLLC